MRRRLDRGPTITDLITEWAEEPPFSAVDLSPMAVAEKVAEYETRKRKLAAAVAKNAEQIKKAEARLMDLIEEGEFPPKASVGGFTIYLKEETWVSPLDGDYERACAALVAAGEGEFVGTRFNTQSVSARIREMERQEEDIPSALRDTLNITKKPSINKRKA